MSGVFPGRRCTSKKLTCLVKLGRSANPRGADLRCCFWKVATPPGGDRRPWQEPAGEAAKAHHRRKDLTSARIPDLTAQIRDRPSNRTQTRRLKRGRRRREENERRL